MGAAAAANPNVGQRDARSERPSDGDIVVSRDPRRQQYFTIHQVPGAPQISWASRDAAIDVARGFALRHAVDPWISDGQFTTRLLSHRSPGRAKGQ